MIHKAKQQVTFSEHDSSGITIAYTKSSENLHVQGRRNRRFCN
jgi:hypothetical protein